MSDSMLNALQPKKLLNSKWTAVRPVNKEKHFIVTKLIDPVVLNGKIEQVEIEAVHSRRVMILEWRVLLDATVWKQGWV